MEIKSRFDHFNINVTDLAKSLEFTARPGLKETGRKEAADGSFVLAYLGDGQTGFRLELTWLRDHTGAYELGENESHLCMRVAGDYDAVRNPPIDSCLHLKEGGDVTWDYADSTGRITLYLAVWGGRRART